MNEHTDACSPTHAVILALFSEHKPSGVLGALRLRSDQTPCYYPKRLLL
jgi:hypothetical protein